MSDGRNPTSTFGPFRELALDGLQLAGLALQPADDGGRTVTVDRLTIAQMRGQTSTASFSVTRAACTGIVARLASASSDAGAPLREASVGEIRIEGLDAVIHGVRPQDLFAGGALRLDAIAQLDGVLRAFVTDAMWLIDAEIVVPLQHGGIDMSRVAVEHVGPNSTMGIDRAALYVDAPHGRRIDLLAFDGMDMQAVVPADAPGSRRAAARVIDVRALAQALAQVPRDRPGVRIADQHLEAPMKRTRVSGELRLGDGALGTAIRYIVLSGRDDGRNTVEISSPAIGRQVAVRVPRLSAAGAVFAIAGASHTVGEVSAAVDARWASDARLELVLSGVLARHVRFAARGT